MKRAGWFYLAALALGIVVWAAITSVSGRREAWDSSLYFSVGMPLVCAGSMVLAILEPAHSWRWGVIPFAGQFLAMLAAEGVGNLLPLGIVVFGIFSVPAIVAARVGAFFGNRNIARTQS
jgi:hypothetical protein